MLYAVPLVTLVEIEVKFSYPAVPVEVLLMLPKVTLPIFSSAVLVAVAEQYDTVVPAKVVTLTELLAVEMFPAASLAFTEKV